MKGRSWLIATVFAVGGCLVLVNLRTEKGLSTARAELARCRKTADDLEARACDAESERDSVNRSSRELRQELAALREQRKEDSFVIEQLWRGLQRDAQGTEKGIRYDLETIKNMLTSSGDVPQDLLAQILTPEGIQATLEAHRADTTYWVAAASLVHDEDAAFQYLEEAARLYPKSAVVLSSLVEALMRRKQFDETTMAHVAQLKQLDPANSLPDYYDAYCRFQSGDVQGALKCLAEGSVKDRFADNGMDLLMARYNYLLDGGCSDAIAMGLSAFSLPLPHMAMVRSVGRDSIEQASAYASTGQYQEALRVADAVLRTGNDVSSSGRFLINDLVGIALQESALKEQRKIYEALGNAVRTEEIDSQLRATEERRSIIKTMAGAFEGVFRGMTEEEISTFVERTIQSGEFSALRDIPAVAEALEGARSQGQQRP
jgi:tetratricopeptide (TPR) repeat protein